MSRRDLPPAVVVEEADRPDVRGVDVLLTIDEVAAIYRLSTTTVRTRLQRGTFRPLPWDKYPYRWTKSDIENDLRMRRAEQRFSGHGYAAKPKPLRAARPTRPRRIKPPKAVNE
jgi:hypothetical protein